MQTSGVVKHHFFVFCFFFCFLFSFWGFFCLFCFCLAGDTLTQCTTFHGSFHCIIVMIKINRRPTPKQLVHGLQIQSSYNITIYILKYIC